MKRTEIYCRDYASVAQGDGTLKPDERDIIREDLGGVAAGIGADQFIYFDGTALVVINVSGKPMRTSWANESAWPMGTRVNYEVRVGLEIMPPNAQMPRGVTDLLEREGFKTEEEWKRLAREEGEAIRNQLRR